MAIASQQNAYNVLALLCLHTLAHSAMATQFRVGGSHGWSEPIEADEYDRWAKRMRFQIGDSLLFEYPAGEDSVLQVHKEDYETCNTQSPIVRFDDGSTVFMFNHSGPYFFISGVVENCLENEKLIIVVMADRSNNSAGSNEPGRSPPEGSIGFVPTPPYTPNAATTKVAGVLCTMGAILSSFLLFRICEDLKPQ